MVVDMKVILAKAKSMARAPFFGKMGRFTKATGSMTKPMESASTLISMGRCILVIGSTISSTESAQRKELIIHISRVIIKMDFTMDLEFTLKLMALNIQDSGNKISFMV